MRIGGVEQWVMVRGESVSNPALILLHGGPGFSETHFFRHFNAPLEKAFTVVYWDQRGSGKSFDRKIPKASMTVEQFILDLDELVDAVQERLNKETVALFGHSWGSALGILYAAQFPEKVSAYIGSGQIGDWQAGERASYAYALTKAAIVKDDKALKKLREIGPPPHSAKDLWVQRTTLNRLEGQMSLKSMVGLLQMYLHEPSLSVFDLLNQFRGFRFSLDAMWEEVSKINLHESAPALKVPVFFLLGRNDHWVPSEVSMSYFDALDAPSKEVVWFESSGHEPFVDEPEKFNRSMMELVRPTLS